MQAHSKISPSNLESQVLPPQVLRRPQGDASKHPLEPSLWNEEERDIGLAHDAANLLAAIGLYCDLLDRPGTLQPQHRHYAAELRQLSERGASMLRQLLPQLGPRMGPQHPCRTAPLRQPAETEPADHALSPNQTLARLEPLLHTLAGPQIQLHLHLSDSSDVTYAADALHAGCGTGDNEARLALDPEALERIAVNLTLNAAQSLQKYDIRVPAAIHLTLRRVARHLCLAVSDNGPGLSAEAAQALLRPSALRQASERGHGHRIVHSLATQTGGRVAVRSALGEGTTISVRWPLSLLERCGLLDRYDAEPPPLSLQRLAARSPQTLSRPLNVC